MTRITLTITDETKTDEFLKEVESKSFINIESIIDDDQLDEKLLASEEAVKYGDIISQSQLEKEIESWREK